MFANRSESLDAIGQALTVPILVNKRVKLIQKHLFIRKMLKVNAKLMPLDGFAG